MFGHSPPAIARALAETGAMGITSMLPAERVARVGEKLAALFGLPFWQMTQTATDANRAVLRWARAITGRARMLRVRRLLSRHRRGNAGARSWDRRHARARRARSA